MNSQLSWFIEGCGTVLASSHKGAKAPLLHMQGQDATEAYRSSQQDNLAGKI